MKLPHPPVIRPVFLEVMIIVFHKIRLRVWEKLSTGFDFMMKESPLVKKKPLF
jgi:hypothetical protein